MAQTQYNPGVPEEIVVDLAPVWEIMENFAYTLKKYRKARKTLHLQDANGLLVIQGNLVAAHENLTQAVKNLAVAVELLGIKPVYVIH
jgi:hypothetical protein